MDETFQLTPKYGILLFGSRAHQSKHNVRLGLIDMYKATAEQLTRPNYDEDSVKLTKKKLAVLAEYGFVEIDLMPTRQYRSPYYYVLGNKTIECARELGIEISSSYRPSKEIGQNYYHLLHHKGVVDIMISAATLKRYDSTYSLEAHKLERELAHESFTTSWRSKQYTLVPDLFLDMRQALPNGKQHVTSILCEFDRGTESEEVIRRKVHAYSDMLTSGWYETRYNVTSITIAFVTFEGVRRRDKLREWARQELRDTSLADYFLFTTQQQPPDPQQMWLGRCWLTPTSNQPIAILADEEATDANT